MRDLLSNCESGGVGSETRRHVSNFTRSTPARLSGKTTSSWSLVHQDPLQICKGLKWQHPTATVLSTNMQRYNNNNNNNATNMTFDDTPSYFGGHESFGMDTTAEQAHVDSSLDPSAGFAGLGELPSAGNMESGVDQHGSFTGDLNASAYDVGEDHSQLLHDMLQQQQQQSQTNQSGHSPQSSQGGASASAWEDSLHVLQEMLLLQQQQQAQQIYQSQAEQVFSHAFSSSTAPHDRGSINHHHHHATTTGYNNNKSSTLFPGESELLSLLQLPRTLSLPSSGFSPMSSNRGKGPLYSTSTIAGPVNTGEFFESRLGLSHGSLHHHGGATHTAASFFHTLPRGDLQSGNHSSLLTRPPPILLDLDHQDRGDADDGKAATPVTSPFGLKRDRQQGVGVGVGVAGGVGMGKAGGEARGVNHFATERQRREFLNEKYQTLRALVPNPTKADRASIVADAIDYVKELKRTVLELQQLLHDKRRAAGHLGCPGGRKRSHRCMAQTAEGQDGTGTAVEMHKGTSEEMAMAMEGGLSVRSSWVQRASGRGTSVDVRIVHDEVTIKLSQRRLQSRSPSCLLLVFSALQELRLDLLQATGASIGEHDVFLFNSKILEGSSTFAGYIAAKMLDAVDPRPLM